MERIQSLGVLQALMWNEDVIEETQANYNYKEKNHTTLYESSVDVSYTHTHTHSHMHVHIHSHMCTNKPLTPSELQLRIFPTRISSTNGRNTITRNRTVILQIGYFNMRENYTCTVER